MLSSFIYTYIIHPLDRCVADGGCSSVGADPISIYNKLTAERRCPLSNVICNSLPTARSANREQGLKAFKNTY